MGAAPGRVGGWRGGYHSVSRALSTYPGLDRLRTCRVVVGPDAGLELRPRWEEVDALAVALEPLGGGDLPQPAGCHGREHFQRGAQGLADEFHLVPCPHGGQHVRGVGALTASRPQQSQLAYPLRRKRQRRGRAEWRRSVSPAPARCSSLNRC
jgi:hypothetical protein